MEKYEKEEKQIKIFVNQIGYDLNGSKFAYATGTCDNGFFGVRNVETNQIVFSAKACEPVVDRVAGDPVVCFDFSSICDAGKYQIVFSKSDNFEASSDSAGFAAESFSFVIDSKIYDDLFYSTLNYFYLSRCGQDIDGGDWSHPACHTAPALIYGTDIRKNVTGGWHDAGDYGRYVVAGAKAVMDLLLAYEQCKNSFTGFDILSEVRFELEWMLQLQREDGAVFHKISCFHFCGFINPQDEKDELVLSPISTTATADFAGVCAFASSFFKRSDSAFAKKLMNAALKAQKYLDSHDDELFKNPPEITTGGYGDWTASDERYFALAALFEQTGDEKYLNKAMEIRLAVMNAPKNPDMPWINGWSEGFGWGMVSGYGTIIFLRNQDKISDKAIVKSLYDSMLKKADDVLKRVDNAAFGTSIEKVFWGSNGHVCDDAHAFFAAYELTGKKEYYEAAKKQFDYLLGCNPNNICYITGFGTNTVQYPHHRPSGAVGKTVPGMLAGGPCEGLLDAVAKEKLGPLNLPPLKCYIDHVGSYSTNEVAIYWNSSFVYLVAMLKLV